MAGETFEYNFDGIGNRNWSKRGYDSQGYSLRTTTYTPNNLNQYTQIQNPGVADFLGTAAGNATVSVFPSGTSLNQDPDKIRRALRQSEGGFYAELPVTNNDGPVWGNADITGAVDDQTPNNPDQVQTISRSYFVPKASQTLEYDLDGNLTTDGQWIYSWDGENQLQSIETNVAALDDRRIKLEFVYDSQGRRAIKKRFTRSAGDWALSETRAFVWAGWIMVADLLQNGGTWAVDRRYYWGPDLSGSLEGAGGVGGLLWTEHGANDRHGYAFDGNGNVVGMIDLNTGAASARYERGPFGEPLEESGPAAAGNRFRFSTKYEDETGLVYYGYRHYHPELGRWISRDPSGERQMSPLYHFNHNSPHSWTDALGRAPIPTGNLPASELPLAPTAPNPGGGLIQQGSSNATTAGTAANIVVARCAETSRHRAVLAGLAQCRSHLGPTTPGCACCSIPLESHRLITGQQMVYLSGAATGFRKPCRDIRRDWSQHGVWRRPQSSNVTYDVVLETL